jgi:hypothetical protein
LYKADAAASMALVALLRQATNQQMNQSGDQLVNESIESIDQSTINRQLFRNRPSLQSWFGWSWRNKIGIGAIKDFMSLCAHLQEVLVTTLHGRVANAMGRGPRTNAPGLSHAHAGVRNHIWTRNT